MCVVKKEHQILVQCFVSNVLTEHWPKQAICKFLELTCLSLFLSLQS